MLEDDNNRKGNFSFMALIFGLLDVGEERGGRKHENSNSEFCQNVMICNLFLFFF